MMESPYRTTVLTALIFYTNATNITIQNCVLEHIGTNTSQDQGIYIMASTANITIRNNLIQHIASCGIQGWHGPNVNGLLIYNNIITNCNFGILLGDDGQNIRDLQQYHRQQRNTALISAKPGRTILWE